MPQEYVPVSPEDMQVVVEALKHCMDFLFANDDGEDDIRWRIENGRKAIALLEGGTYYPPDREPCKWCDCEITNECGVWIDDTGGDVCCHEDCPDEQHKPKHEPLA